MNNNWKDFLKQQGAVIADDGSCEFSQNASASAFKAPLTHLGVISLAGQDRQAFLQGQLTNDTRNIGPDSSQLSSYCTPKGRMLANFRILASDEDYWLMVIPHERLQPVHKRLGMFVLRSQVTLKDATDEFAVIGFSGDCLADHFTALPDRTDQVIHEHGIHLVCINPETPRYMAIGEIDAVIALWKKTTDAASAGTSAWRLADIRDGIPTVFDATQEAFIPQMTNLQLINGVSFTKGCYTGQEVVARMQYLGKLKRRMYRVSFQHDSMPAVGDDIYASSSQSGQGAGKLVDVAATGDGHFEGLAVLEIGSLEQGDIRLYDEHGPLLEVVDPPYAFEADNQNQPQ